MFSFVNCEYKVASKKIIEMQNMIVIYVAIKYHIRKVYQDTRRLYMSQIPLQAMHATIKLLLSQILLSTKGQFMNKSKSLAGIATI